MLLPDKGAAVKGEVDSHYPQCSGITKIGGEMDHRTPCGITVGHGARNVHIIVLEGETCQADLVN